MRKIDCAHSRSVKMLPWPWFRENIDFFDLFYTSTWFEKTFLHQQASVVQWQSSGLLVTKVAGSNPAWSQIFLHKVKIEKFLQNFFILGCSESFYTSLLLYTFHFSLDTFHFSFSLLKPQWSRVRLPAPAKSFCSKKFLAKTFCRSWESNPAPLWF